MVLSIPFALSQTRKAIPAGRYEALSGVKVSHGSKSVDNFLTKDSLGLFWSEVLKQISQEKTENFFYSIGATDANVKAFLVGKGVHEAKNLDNRVNILLSDSLERDSGIFKNITTKGSLVVLKDKHGLKDILSTLNRFDVIIYQAEVGNNYFLLKLK